MRRFLYTIGVTLAIFTASNTYAVSEVITEKMGYTVRDEGTDLWLSRDGAKPFKVKTGDTIHVTGDYYLIDKLDNTYKQFSISDTETMLVTNTEQLEEEIYQGLKRHDETFTLVVDSSITFEDVKACLKELPYKYPLLDYAGGSMSRRGNELILSMNYRLSHKEYVEYTNTVKKELDGLIATLDLEKEDVELELELARWLRDRATYYRNGKDVPSDSITHLVQSLAIGDELVCDGYSKTYMYLLNSIGIPTEIVVGTVSTGPHAWNIVNLGQEYYHVDITWSDTELETESDYINYFNEKDNFMKLSHTWDISLHPPCVANTYYNLNMFDFVDDTLGNFTRSHSILTDSSKGEMVIQKVAKQLKSGFSYCTYDKYGKTVITLLDQ